jgi:hypothetical protein
VQGFVQQDAGVVAGEGAAGLVGAVEAGGQADDEQLRPFIAEGWHRAAVIAGMAGAAGFKEGGKAGAGGAVGGEGHGFQSQCSPLS